MSQPAKSTPWHVNERNYLRNDKMSHCSTWAGGMWLFQDEDDLGYPPFASCWTRRSRKVLSREMCLCPVHWDSRPWARACCSGLVAALHAFCHILQNNYLLLNYILFELSCLPDDWNQTFCFIFSGSLGICCSSLLAYIWELICSFHSCCTVLCV